MWWINISLVEATCKLFYEVIHYLAKFFEYAVHYIFQVSKGYPTPALKLKFLTEICMRLLENSYHLYEYGGYHLENC
jgi:hypothetical protein